MAYREPESSIYLLKGCPCDLEYNNTIYFENKTKQWAYFRTLSILSLSKQYYQRYERGYLRIQARADDLYGVNYMVFSNDPRFASLNPNLEDIRVFYCFVDNVEYINENVTEIHYTIDVMQTYMFDYKLGQCFVEREHTLTDEIGEFRAPEPFEGLDYYYTQLYQLQPDVSISATEPKSQYYICVEYVPNEEYVSAWKFDQNGLSANGGYILYTWSPVGVNLPGGGFYEPKGEIRNNGYSGSKRVYIPLYMQSIPLSNPYDYHNIELFISEAVSKSCTIVKMTLFPNYMVHISEEVLPPANNYYDWNKLSLDRNVDLTRNQLSFEDNKHNIYTPKNNKIFQAPYDTIYVTSNNGNDDEYAWENFGYRTSNNRQIVSFRICGTVLGTPEISIIPRQYDTWSDYNYTRRVSLNNFPSISWSEDSFARMWSENQTKITNGLIQSAIMSMSSAITSGAVGMAIGGPVGGSLGGAIGAAATKVLNRGITKADVKAGMNRVLNLQSQNAQLANLEGTAGQKILSHQVASLIDAVHQRDTLNGEQSGSQIPIIINKYGFTIFRKCIKPYYAKMIDDYFSMYGYSIKELKIPNIQSADMSELRPHWNYIKNVQTTIIPFEDNGEHYSVEHDVEVTLQSIYDKGITFWMDGEEVGDYSLDNSPQI